GGQGLRGAAGRDRRDGPGREPPADQRLSGLCRAVHPSSLDERHPPARGVHGRDGGGCPMITRPTTAQLLEVIRRELADNVRPAVSDQQVLTSLHMVDHMLSALAVRADHELGWMAEEMAAIDEVGERVAASDLPGAGGVTEALEAF